MYQLGMTTEGKFWSNINKDGPIPPEHPELGPCWLWTAGKSSGYGLIRASGQVIPIYAHRYSWELHNNQPVPAGLNVCHRCDVRACVRPDHLFIGTQGDNIRDALAKGRLAPQRETFKRLWREEWGDRRGSNIHCSKLTDDDVREIKRIYALGEAGYKTLGDQFGISFGSVRDIIKGTSWAHIK